MGLYDSAGSKQSPYADFARQSASSSSEIPMRTPSELHAIDYPQWSLEELEAAVKAGERDEIGEITGSEEHFSAIEYDRASEELVKRREKLAEAERETIRYDLIVKGMRWLLTGNNDPNYPWRKEGLVRWDSDYILTDLFSVRAGVQALIDEVVTATKPSWVGPALERRIIDEVTTACEEGVDPEEANELWVAKQMADVTWPAMLDMWAEFVAFEDGEIDMEDAVRSSYPEEWGQDNPVDEHGVRR